MAKTTCVMMDVVTEKSGHSVTPMAVSVCLTPAAPAPLPLPYPVVAQVAEGISDTPMRTKMDGNIFATVGSVLKTCHGNEPGTLKEVVSLNTTGPVFVIMGAPTVISELGMVAITGSPCISNKAPTPGAGGSASDASGTSDAGSGAGTDGSGDGGDKKADNQNGGGGADGDGTSTGASATPATPAKQDEYCPKKGTRAPPPNLDHIEDMDLRSKKNQEKKKKGTQTEKELADMACDGAPGGAPGFAFWSGKGRKEATDDGYKVQEDVGGAKAMEQHGAKHPGASPNWNETCAVCGSVNSEHALSCHKCGAHLQGPHNHHKGPKQTNRESGITNERLWKTISMRSAENSSGDVTAFVAGKAHKNNVFATTELPTLLHNDKVKSIEMREPKGNKWTRDPPSPDCPAGKWKGAPVAGSPTRDGKPTSFGLHPTDGVKWTP